MDRHEDNKPARAAEVSRLRKHITTKKGKLTVARHECEAINGRYYDAVDEDNDAPEQVPRGEQLAQVLSCERRVERAERLLAKPSPTQGELDAATAIAKEVGTTMRDELGLKVRELT